MEYVLSYQYTLPSQASFHLSPSKPGQKRLVVWLKRVCSRGAVGSKWKKKKRKKKATLIAAMQVPLMISPRKPKKPCRVPPEMFLQSQGSPSLFECCHLHLEQAKQQTSACSFLLTLHRNCMYAIVLYIHSRANQTTLLYYITILYYNSD